jgi:hypothetical protein
MMSSQRLAPDFQKHSAAMTAATIDKYDIASGEIRRLTHKFVAAFPVRRKICAIGRWDVGWYSTIATLSERPSTLPDKSDTLQKSAYLPGASCDSRTDPEIQPQNEVSHSRRRQF